MKIQIIIGSTRPGRVGPQIADWIPENLPKQTEINYEIVDLAAQNLPLFDEPVHPSANQYTRNHTKTWSQKIKEGDGYIFLTPEYNAGYPAALKNAIDYLFHEWTAKPVSFAADIYPTLKQLKRISKKVTVFFCACRLNLDKLC
jgi:NAD(P)H-dependent FMN reductase